MIFALLMAISTLIFLAIASYSDLKSRMVDDWLSYALLFSALGLRLLFSLKGDWVILISGLVGTAFMFIFAAIFYYTKQWGGADSKILMGMGAVIGADFFFKQNAWELVAYFFILLTAGALYGMLWSVFVALQRRKSFMKAWKKQFKEHQREHVLAWLGTLFIIIVGLFLPPLYVLAFAPVLAYYLFTFAAAVEVSCFHKKVPTTILVVGDYVLKDLYHNRKKIFTAKLVDKKEIRELMSLEAEGKIDGVVIKEGIPFIPSFFFAYLILILAQDWIRAVLLFIF